MRSYAQIVPTFWTRGSGKALRGKPHAQVLALYLMTCPSGSMCGLFYLPKIMACHETGLTEKQFDSALADLAGIAKYDPDAELVWLPGGARYQLGETLSAGDKRRRSLEKAASQFGPHPFAVDFFRMYSEPFHLTAPWPLPAPSPNSNSNSNRGAPSTAGCPIDAPSKGLPTKPDGASEIRLAAYRIYEYWIKARGKSRRNLFTDERKRKVEARLRGGYTEDDLRRAIDGVARSPHHRGENDTGQVWDDLELICRDGKHVEMLRDMPDGGRNQLQQEKLPSAVTQESLLLPDDVTDEELADGSWRKRVREAKR
jgi:hypothetical protein